MKIRTVAVSVVGILVLCSALAWAQNGVAARNGNQNSGVNCLNLPTAASLQPLTDAEKEWLLYMAREERLAFDVYLELFEAWELPVFAKIAVSEKRHVAAIDKLLANYSLSYSDGAYLDEEFAEMYESLMAEGLVSPEGALNVGTKIEEQDIADLTSALDETEKKDIRTVYENLRDASEKHLLAFESCQIALASN